jgi:uncharacterized protein (TIGR02246 family)
MTTETVAADTPVRPQDAQAALALVQRISSSWAQGDADTMCTVYSEDASIVLPGFYLKGRDQIRAALAAQFEGRWKNTKVLGAPLELRYLSEDSLLLISEGGAFAPGAAEVPVESAIRGIWFFLKRDGEWLIHAYGNTPVGHTIPVPEEQR